MDCIFCKIINSQIPCNKVYEDDKVLAFYDLEPQAPKHVLVITKEHISSLNDVNSENSSIISHIFEVIKIIAEKLELSNGYRVVTNCGEDGGQTVGHIHFHVLGGRSMEWPPG